MTHATDLRFPMDPAAAAAMGLDASDLRPPELAQTGDSVMDRQQVIHPLDGPRVEAAAIAQIRSLFQRCPDLLGLSLILWSWRLFPFVEKDASEDPHQFLIIEPQRLMTGPLLRVNGRAFPEGVPEQERLILVRDPAVFAVQGQRQRLPGGSLSEPLSLDGFVDIARQELSLWAHPLCARHLLAAGWGPLCRSQSVSSGWDSGRFNLSRLDPLDPFKTLYPAGASLLEALALNSELAPSPLPPTARRSL